MPQLYSRLFLLLSLLLATVGAMDAQNIRISQGGRVNVCAGTFFDSGGPNGNHSTSGQFQEITLCPDGSGGTHVQLVFSRYSSVGTMTIFNGPTNASPVLEVITTDEVGMNAIIRASAANVSGCLTVRFESAGNGPGWEAAINCVTSCSPVNAVLVSTTPAAMPDASGYIDVCPGQSITFRARGDYPDAGNPYPQSDATSTFTWFFQDGTTATGPTVAHVYDEPGGYVVQLFIDDVRGCRSSNSISQRVRVAPPPIFNIPTNLGQDLCVGEEIPFVLGRPATGNGLAINPAAQEFSFNTSQTLTELTALPDGNGTEYSSPLFFTNFNPGQTLQQGADLVRICATMEHSYLGDLDIWLECPDGNRLDLHRFGANNNVRRQLLGQGNENTTTPDPPGVYCWTATAPRTMTQTVDAQNIRDGETMPEIDYAAEQNFNNLAGCPLNGNWTLNIRDNILRDNGYIYSWTIEFASEVYPDQETFLVPIQSLAFAPNPAFGFYSADSVLVAPRNPGQTGVTIISTDVYGCVYDTTIAVEYLSPFDPACADCDRLLARNQVDTAICIGGSFTPNVAGPAPNDTLVTWTSSVPFPFGNSLYPNANTPLSSIINVTSQNPNRILDANADLLSVCVNLENNGPLNEVTLQLVAPNGRTLTLLENFGGSGQDLTQTCFSPTATALISSAAPPYTGTFRASNGGWTAFNTSNANGVWSLRAWDRAGNDLGAFLSWSITLRYDREITYRWTPANASLSCTDCPNPTITPTAAGTYTLTVTTADGCSEQATVNVTANVLDLMVTETLTQPACPGTATGAIDLTIMGAGGNTFLWSDGVTTQNRTGLRAGTYSVQVTAPNGCRDDFSYTLTDPPALSLNLEAVMDVRCNGGSTGEIEVRTTGGTPPYSYLWDDPNAQNDEDAGALEAGTYNLVVTDARGCTATLAATVNEPLPITLSFRPYAVRCLNGDDGRAVAVAAGGNGGYTYAWQTGAVTDSVSNLMAGSYEVTVTDRLGCQTMATVAIAQPATPVTATVGQDEQGCFGTSTNRATVVPMGGSGGYTYLWSNGETAATAVALPAGNQTVTVTDNGGCAQTFSVVLTDLPAVTANIITTPPSCNDRADGRLGVIPGGGTGQTEADYTYQWSTGGTGVVITNVPGGRIYGVTVTDGRGCTTTAERLLPAPPPITFSVVEDPVDCFGNATGGLTLTNINGPNPGNFAIQWGPAANNSTAASISGLPAGNNYRVRITDVGTCTVDTVLRITEPALLAPSITKRDVGCFGETNGSISVMGTGGVGGYTYLWNTGATQNQLSNLAAGTYDLTLTDANACQSISSVVVTEPAPVGITAEAVAALCAGEATGRITLTGAGGRPPYVFGLENRGFTRNNVFIGLPAAEYVAFVRDSAGCSISTTAIVNDGPVFSLDLGPDQDIIFGDSLRLMPALEGGIGMITYNWRGAYPGTLSCEDCPEPLASPEYEIDYTLTVMDETGCEDEDRVRVRVRKIREVAVPSGFSPNGDTRNDLLLVHGRPGTRVLNFAIFDRWGNLLFEDGDFEVNDPLRGWDGTKGGQPVNAGVYLYRVSIQYDDLSEETLAGETSLIR
ncbi:proprotein convertase P-domain-containing protein [Neolewinella lacunae]|uniref:Proprotein convertase P-domain-containing protein n=1 Tax=Neolewinella lacunae TaxID=1517758 RepID=A0A923T7Z8_9BACT|nr:proprotein convertase P-domain-containing protein [Neolewinella lacunae]MBC6994059.1 proprotein convertase P-domain-containing protein [Neolewinella lacunae]MDN3636070.1 proprotein convertase P-domain-containing protein [Neolewinella lacunae]